MDNSSGKSFSLDSDSVTDELHASCKGNPATNDWIPASENTVANLNSVAYTSFVSSCHIIILTNNLNALFALCRRILSLTSLGGVKTEEGTWGFHLNFSSNQVRCCVGISLPNMLLYSLCSVLGIKLLKLITFFIYSFC